MRECILDNTSDALKRVYKESSDFIILGLTGRTGSGCSTAAKILSEDQICLPEKSKIYETANDHRKYKIVRSYISENWKPFKIIQIRVIITGVLLELDFHDFEKLVFEVLQKDKSIIKERLASYQTRYEEAHKEIKNYKSLKESNDQEKKIKKEKAWEVYFSFLPNFCAEIKKYLQEELGVDSYTLLYQKIGDNIRASGKANIEEFDPEKIFTIPKIINKLIKVIREKCDSGTFIAIDAIRNPFEAYFFHQRYAGFYLISINTPNDERLKHLRESHKFSEDQIKALDDKEYPKKISGKEIFISQNIQKCIEISDIHLNNPDRQKFNNNELCSQLIWYISLILHPGLVTPTSIERCMQLAYSSKLNSGCISRQVGAVVTDQNYSIKAIGWNNTPEGQTPCLLRNAQEILNGGDENVYSRYERTNENFHNTMRSSFQNALSHNALKGRLIPYCFKDIQNKIEDEKNQVHTRSLHAEENAFLQISKYGGEAIKGGFLFTTASPCELCSKKAYQLGISQVIFIDPYPGISEEHILNSGRNIPKLILYRGTIGRAYHRLYMPLLAYKDELKMLTGYTITDGKPSNISDIEKIKLLEEENAQLRQEVCNCKKSITSSSTTDAVTDHDSD